MRRMIASLLLFLLMGSLGVLLAEDIGQCYGWGCFCVRNAKEAVWVQAEPWRSDCNDSSGSILCFGAQCHCWLYEADNWGYNCLDPNQMDAQMATSLICGG